MIINSELIKANKYLREKEYLKALYIYKNKISGTNKNFYQSMLGYNINKCRSGIEKDGKSGIVAGLVAWGVTTGNGGMASDLAKYSAFIKYWLVPEHFSKPYHKPYISVDGVVVCKCKVTEKEKIKSFLDKINVLIYIESTCIQISDFNLVSEAHAKGIVVVGVPMWEWWPFEEDWARNTDFIWAVTKFTKKYLLDYVSKYGSENKYKWSKHIYGGKNGWGVDLSVFKFRQRVKAERFVFVNGNGGFKGRKGLEVVIECFKEINDIPLIIYTQKPLDNLSIKNKKNVTVIEKDFTARQDVYKVGDVFLFPSYWEGLCHGIYEAQAVGGVVVTTDHPPMNEPGCHEYIKVEAVVNESLYGNKILKALPSAKCLQEICRELYDKDIRSISLKSRSLIEKYYALESVVDRFEESIFLFVKEL